MQLRLSLQVCAHDRYVGSSSTWQLHTVKAGEWKRRRLLLATRFTAAALSLLLVPLPPLLVLR